MKLFITSFLSLTFFINVYGQNNITDTYIKNFEQPREVVYVHLNKTTFAKDEYVGFKAYVFDKASKELSKKTRNLYCVISDLDGNNLKEQLLLVENGVTSSSIQLEDSLFTEGNYTFKAYTNWMRNFDEPNFFTLPITVIDSDIARESETKTSAVVEPDIQLLPEGGHLLAHTINTLGVIAKDQFGNGLRNAEAYLVNEANDTLNKFTLDRFGIGKTLISPSLNEKYKVLIKQGYTFYEEPVSLPKSNGLAMSLTETEEELFVTVSTNDKTLSLLADKKFTLAIHNGSAITTQSFEFKDNLKLSIRYDKSKLYSGVNIFTIFSDKNKPILERLFFNYKGVKDYNVHMVKSKTIQDSVTLNINVKDIDPKKFSSLSVSVLPSTTKAFNSSENLLSKLFLQPYIKGKVENASYYFTEITEKKKFELNNLLLTQGWSSYDWNGIFGSPKVIMYKFEDGISFTANINKRKSQQYLISPLSNSKSFLVDLPRDQKKFEGHRLFPINDEKLVINGINEKGKSVKPGIYTTFSPNKVPLLNTLSANVEQVDNSIGLLFDANDAVFELDKGLQELSEVEIVAKKKDLRREKLEKEAFGKLFIVDKNLRDSNVSFANWLASKGYTVVEDVTQDPQIQIVNQRRTTFSGSSVPLIIFDGVPLRGSSINLLFGFSMANIDYVDIDKNGFSAPFGGGQGFGGVIRINTKKEIDVETGVFGDLFVKDFDLTFSANKKFYVPKYQNYNSTFFNNFGVIDWKSDLTPDANGNISLTFFNTRTDEINLYIEGVVNDTGFLSEMQTIQLD